MVKIRSKILLIAVIGLAVIASGCTGGQDVTSVVKALPEVQQFMKEHPNAQITVTYWSKEEVAQSSQEISQQCDKHITPVAMYKATVSEGDLKIVSWINAENQIVMCSTTTGSGKASSETTPKSGTQTNDLRIINLHAGQIILTDTEIKELVGTGLTIKRQSIIPETKQNEIHVLSGISVEYGNPNISIALYVSPTLDAANGVSQSLASDLQKNIKVIVNRVDMGDTIGEIYSIVGSQNEKTTVVIGGSYIIFRKNNIVVLMASTPDVKIESLLGLAKKQDEKIIRLLENPTSASALTPIPTTVSRRTVPIATESAATIAENIVMESVDGVAANAGTLTSISITVKLAAGGSDIDLSKVLLKVNSNFYNYSSSVISSSTFRVYALKDPSNDIGANGIGYTSSNKPTLKAGASARLDADVSGLNIKAKDSITLSLTPEKGVPLSLPLTLPTFSNEGIVSMYP